MDSTATAAPRRAQFEALYLEHHGFVGRCLARWGVEPSGLDDARQDVFLTAFRRLHTYAGHASIRAWLAGIARRVAWRHRRTRQRHDRRVDALAQHRPEVTSLEEWVRTREAQAVLDSFVDALDPPKREAFVLCELEGLSAREAASATGVNAATLYSRLRVARSSFASMCASLEQDGIAVQPEHAAAIHRTVPRSDRTSAMRGWAALAPKVLTVGAASVLTKSAIAVGAGLLGVTGFLVVRPSPPPAPVTSVHAAPTAAQASPPKVSSPEPAAQPRVALGAEPAEPAVKVPPAPTPRAPKPLEPAADDLPRQVELLGTAERHLDRGGFGDAITAAEAHLSRWPKGPLARDALRVAVRAHCESGRRDAALALSRKHLPAADVEPWMQRRCKKDPEPFMNRPSGGD